MSRQADEPAFPTSFIASDLGLTKREEFTKAAMQGLLACNTSLSRSDTIGDRIAIAETAVGFADAVLAELERNKR